LGVAPERIVLCGNLKYDMEVIPTPLTIDLRDCGVEGHPLLVVGSTHEGEEEMLLDLFNTLLVAHPDLAMVIAPRAISRAAEVLVLANKRRLRCRLRSTQRGGSCQVLILDTLGELAQVYQHADLAFVGGSLVQAGGHNPLEPACYGKPILFGPDMSDFAEISRNLCEAGAAVMVTKETILPVTATLLNQEEQRLAMGRAALALVQTHQGSARRHLRLIRESMPHAQ
jgi:3-deoxy-D-manno-octulosonic-acid transferase